MGKAVADGLYFNGILKEGTKNGIAYVEVGGNLTALIHSLFD
jgi:hypothetical protein